MPSLTGVSPRYAKIPYQGMMRLGVQVGTPFLPADSSVRLVSALLKLEGIGGGGLAVRLGIIVDVSESMRLPILDQSVLDRLRREGRVRQATRDGVPVWEVIGPPPPELLTAQRALDAVKTALAQIVERMGPSDQFFVVAFAGQAQTVVPLSQASDRRLLLSRLDDLDRANLGDETRLALGLREALLNTQGRQEGTDLTRWIVLTDGFAQDESDCRTVAAQAAEIGVGISTIGLGAQFNDDLMVSLADQTGGNAEWVPVQEDIPTALAREFESVRKVAVARAELLLALTQGVEVRKVLRVRPQLAPAPTVAREKRQFAVQLGDLEEGEPVHVLIEFLAPPRPEGMFRLARAELKGAGDRRVSADVIVTYTRDERQIAFRDPEVIRAVEAVTAADLQTRALRDLQRGEVDSATKKLQSAATRLLNLGRQKEAHQIQELAEKLEETGSAAPEETKRIRYQTRRLTST